MLRILDRYILVHYVQTFVICFVSLVGLYVVTDGLTHLDQFIAHADEHGGLLGLLTRYYGYRSIAFFDSTSAILALIAAIFTVLWLRRHHEMTAILSAGVPKIRILAPILIPALAIGLLAAANRECLLPRVRGELLRDATELGASDRRSLQPRIDAQTGIIVDGEAIVVATRRIERPRFMLPQELSDQGPQILAKWAAYQPPKADRPGGYLLSGVEEPNGLCAAPSLRQRETSVVLTPRDAPWLKEDQVFVVSGVPFEHLAAGGAWHDYASTVELIRYARSPSVDVAAGVQMTVHSRFLRPLLDATLLFVGLPIILSRGGRNVFLSIGLCLTIVAIFLGALVVCQFLGANSWTSPALAAWLPLLIFAPVAVALRGALTS